MVAVTIVVVVTAVVAAASTPAATSISPVSPVRLAAFEVEDRLSPHVLGRLPGHVGVADPFYKEILSSVFELFLHN